MEDLKQEQWKKLAREPWTHFDGKRTRNVTYLTTFKLLKKHFQQGIFKIFMDAVDNNDAAKILEIAEAVRFFKKNRYPFHTPADPDRGWILFLKERYSEPDERMTIREVAEFIAGGKVESSPDGFSVLRRKCKELNFPLAESRKTKKK